MEKTYVEQLEELYEQLKADPGIPEERWTEIEETLASLRDLLWEYSA